MTSRGGSLRPGQRLSFCPISRQSDQLTLVLNLKRPSKIKNKLIKSISLFYRSHVIVIWPTTDYILSDKCQHWGSPHSVRLTVRIQNNNRFIGFRFHFIIAYYCNKQRYAIITQIRHSKCSLEVWESGLRLIPIANKLASTNDVANNYLTIIITFVLISNGFICQMLFWLPQRAA